MKTNLCILASTSSGNCTLVWNRHTAVLVDCGVGIRYLSAMLGRLGLGVEKLSGVLLTHLHRDHINPTTAAALLRANVPLYCHRDAALPLMGILGRFPDHLMTVFDDAAFDAGAMNVRSFAVQHDADGGCRGYTLRWDGTGKMRSAVIATDLGVAGAELVREFHDADAVVIESNHDEGMLARDTIPYFLKRRIAVAHLSNERCGRFLGDVLDACAKPPQAVFLAHISQHRNTEELALGHVRALCAHRGHAPSLHLSHLRTPSEVIAIS